MPSQPIINQRPPPFTDETLIVSAARHDSAVPTNVRILPSADVAATLHDTDHVAATILDPWYNRGTGGVRDDYDSWLHGIINMACNISNHVFVWGFPDILAAQVARIPAHCRLVAWLTWYYRNCPSVVRGWRPAHNTCLHIAQRDATLYPEHFLNDEQLHRWKAGKMRFIPGPPSVIEAPLNIGFVGKTEQTGHPAQKPLSTIEPLILMATQAHDTVLDPMCGSGTTGAACLQLSRNAILCDISADYLSEATTRLAADAAGC